MAASVVRHLRFALAALAAIVLAGVLLFAWAGSSARAGEKLTTTPAAKRGPAESVLVVRRAAGHDALWLLSPVDGTPTAAGDLPGIAGQVAVSPDGLSAAYLPENGAPRVWIGTGPLAPKTISLAGAGVKRAYSFTWIDDGRLLVSGVTRANADYFTSRLFLVDAATGKVHAFRGLSGIEPSAATAVGKVAYVKMTIVVPQKGNRGPVVRESLKVLSLSRPGGGRTVMSEQNRIDADYRAFSRPQVSPDAAWFLTGETGSDVRVTYAIRDRDGFPLLSLFTPALQAGAGWDASGRRTAFAGVPGVTGQDFKACVWIYDVDSGSLVRSPGSLDIGTMIVSLSWAPSGRLVANVYGLSGATSRRNLVISGDLSTATDLGTGRLPVWVRE
jgi:hypothetical protein